MADIKIDLGTGDLLISESVSGEALILQRLWVRMNTGIGEYIADTSKGIPMLDWLETRPLPLAKIVTIIKREWETCPGVTSATVRGSLMASGDVVVTGDLTIAGDEQIAVAFTTSRDTGAVARDTNSAVIAPIFLAM